MSKEKKLTGSKFWNPKIGDELVGRLVAIRQSKYNRDLYDIRTDDGIVTVPSSAVLGEVISSELVDQKIRVKFLGWGSEHKAIKESGLYRDFDVFLIER